MVSQFSVKKTLKGASLFGAVILLTGCAAIGTAVRHGTLRSQTLMGKSVFLNPISNSQRTIYVQVHNTTDKNISIQSGLTDAIRAKGYTIMNNPKNAHYLLQVNILQLGRTSKSAAQEMMKTGYGGAMEGAVSGALLAADTGNDAVVGGVGGGIVSTVVDNAVQDVLISGIVDIKITEHVKGHKPKIYTTRIGTTADKVNLAFATARPSLEKNLTKSISGIF